MDSGRNYTSGRRGGGGRGRGRGRGGDGLGGRGRGDYHNQPSQAGQGGRGRGRYDQGGRGRGGDGQGGRGRGYGQNELSQGGGRGRAAPQQWASRSPVQSEQPPSPTAWGYRPPASSPHQQQQVGPRAAGGISPQAPTQTLSPHPRQQMIQGAAGGRSGPWGARPQAPTQTLSPHPPQQMVQGAVGGRSGPWGARPQASTMLSPHSPLQAGSWAAIAQAPPQRGASSSTKPVQTPLAQNPLQLSDSLSSLSISEGVEKQPIRRPDHGGKVKIRSIELIVNHFPLRFNNNGTIYHYDVGVKFQTADGGDPVDISLRKSQARLLKDQIFHENPQLIDGKSSTAYDGERSIFSAICLPEAETSIAKGEDMRRGSYIVKLSSVKELKLSKLQDYLSGNVPDLPRYILQGMDLVMKENPISKRIPLGRCFFSSSPIVDLRNGIEALRGYNQSLKPTLQGLSLCLNYSVLSFVKPLPVIDFLKQHVRGFKDANDVKEFRRDVENALKGLRVEVNHRRTNQKYTIAGLTQEDACDCCFDIVDPKREKSTRNVRLLDYFRENWKKEVAYPNIPCLELGKNQKSNKVPMEFCKLVEGQGFPKEVLEKLDPESAGSLKNLTLPKPSERKKVINEMVRAEDGPYGEIARNFGIELDTNMTKVKGRVIGAPDLELGASRTVKVDGQKCQWNLVKKSFIDSKSLNRWALIDFTGWLEDVPFVNKLIGRCNNLGIQMAKPLVYRSTKVQDLSSVDRVETLLKSVVEKANGKKLQMIVCCVRADKESGYKRLKWVSEKKIGIVTQCCLVKFANSGGDQYLANLCLKINAKLGGSNFKLRVNLLNFDDKEHVMFIGADVNHPAPMNKSCPSIAAVVATVNWPAANRYAARVGPQAHRSEQINTFGVMCLDLIQTYERLNKVKPKRIIVFRDGVSEGQFKMVLAQELLDLKNAICTDKYQPLITVIVAQKRHQTRLFIDKDDGGNVPPGTVVDTTIVHPRDFDFYLCSHFGVLGTSKPAHYYVLWDESVFSSDELQKLIYEMCFTFVRCTKPVSVVPPVYYADMVAYRGRMFQEVAMEVAMDMGREIEDVSFDQDFYCLHDDLKDTMFFV